MNADQARALNDLLSTAGSPALEAQDPAIVETFYSWARGKPVLAVYRQQHPTLSPYLAISEWGRQGPGFYYLVVFESPPGAPVMELHEVEDGALSWTYRPAKRDERNAERKQRFAQRFGAPTVRVPLPTQAAQVPAFLALLVKAIEARREAEAIGTSAGLPAVSVPAAWVLQVHPEAYDLPGALRVCRELTWRVRHHADRIRPGVPAYLWLAGKDGGLFARTEVMTAPALLQLAQTERPFVRDARLSDRALSVRLRVDEVFAEPVAREVLIKHPNLVQLGFLRADQGTAFALTEREAGVLAQLAAGAEPPRVVKISPGEEARFWPECLAGGYICVGWDAVGDLSQYPSKEAFRAAFERHYPYHGSASTVTKKAGELWTLRELQPGDLVVANQGTSQVLAVGEVQAPGYRWQPERAEYRHTVSVRWDTSLARAIQKQSYWGVVTVADVPPDLYRAIALGTSPSAPVERSNNGAAFLALRAALQDAGLFFSEDVLSTYLLALQAKRFVLLTGISGTGKTQLALAVAKQLGSGLVRQQTTEVPEGAFELTVRPYSLKHRRIVLPVDLVAALRMPDAVRNNQTAPIDVAWPEGTAQLALSPYARTVGAGTDYSLRFSEAFRRWLQTNLAVGDPFYIMLEELGEDQPHRLRFGIPRRRTVEAQEDPRYTVISVRPDWTDNRGLLGYYNPVLQQYVTTEFLRLMLRADAELTRARRESRAPKPYFVILDEMNLARVEHYFSDFLSSLESGEPIWLHNDDDVASGEKSDSLPVPKQLAVPANLFFTGTVNVDETTYMFSPKVLDRAFTLELNLVDLAGFSATGVAGEQDAATALTLPGLPSALGLQAADDASGGQVHSRPAARDWQQLGSLGGGDLREIVMDVHQLLERHNRHFGYRVANEIARFVALSHDQAGTESEQLYNALDLALLTKVLPKLHGTQQELESLLASLFAYATSRNLDEALASGDPFAGWQLQRDLLRPREEGVLEPPVLPRVAIKLFRMNERLRRQGFTSFIE